MNIPGQVTAITLAPPGLHRVQVSTFDPDRDPAADVAEVAVLVSLCTYDDQRGPISQLLALTWYEYAGYNAVPPDGDTVFLTTDREAAHAKARLWLDKTIRLFEQREPRPISVMEDDEGTRYYEEEGEDDKEGLLPYDDLYAVDPRGTTDQYGGTTSPVQAP